MTHTQILSSIYDKLLLVNGLPPIAFPNRDFTPNGDYVAVYVLPAKTNTSTYSYGKYQYGIIQIDCVVTEDVGEIKASQYADIIMEAFKIGTKISGDLKVYQHPYASAGMQLPNGYYKIPVDIPYKLLGD